MVEDQVAYHEDVYDDVKIDFEKVNGLELKMMLMMILYRAGTIRYHFLIIFCIISFCEVILFKIMSSLDIDSGIMQSTYIKLCN